MYKAEECRLYSIHPNLVTFRLSFFSETVTSFSSIALELILIEIGSDANASLFTGILNVSNPMDEKINESFNMEEGKVISNEPSGSDNVPIFFSKMPMLAYGIGLSFSSAIFLSH